MTKAQINIAIAEACGWKRVRETAYGPMGCPPGSDLSCTSDDFFRTRMCPVPNFHENLDAMHEAESRFISDASSAMTYAMLLLRVRGLAVVSEYDELNYDYCWHACHATARQRAEAFLRTIGKWEE